MIRALFAGAASIVCLLVAIGCLFVLGVIALDHPWTLLLPVFVVLEYRWIRNGFRKDRTRRAQQAEAEYLATPSALDD